MTRKRFWSSRSQEVQIVSSLRRQLGPRPQQALARGRTLLLTPVPLALSSGVHSTSAQEGGPCWTGAAPAPNPTGMEVLVPQPLRNGAMGAALSPPRAPRVSGGRGFGSPWWGDTGPRVCGGCTLVLLSAGRGHPVRTFGQGTVRTPDSGSYSQAPSILYGVSETPLNESLPGLLKATFQQKDPAAALGNWRPHRWAGNTPREPPEQVQQTVSTRSPRPARGRGRRDEGAWPRSEGRGHCDEGAWLPKALPSATAGTS